MHPLDHPFGLGLLKRHEANVMKELECLSVLVNIAYTYLTVVTALQHGPEAVQCESNRNGICVTRRKSLNVYKSCPKIIALEK